jgi:hypothetical protein
MVEKLLTKLRGKDYRAAYRAIPALCRLNDASIAALVGSYKPKDEQRRFQLELARIALSGGIQALAREWLRLGTDEQRRTLLSEITQYWKEWDGEGSVELAIAALEEPEDKTRGYALLCVMAALQFSKVSPAQRARITQALMRAMARHEERPLGLFMLEKYVELLGMTAEASDQLVIARLERLRPLSGASRRTVVEKLDPDNLPWPDNMLAERKGVRLVASVWDLGTGLLEIKLLEAALKQIRARR